MRRSVTFSVVVNLLSGTFHDVRYRFTFVSRLSVPRSTRRSMAVAATGLLMDAAWKSVAGVTESGLPASFTPKPRAHAMRPPSITAMLTPGTLCCVIRSAKVQRAAGFPWISTGGRRPRNTRPIRAVSSGAAARTVAESVRGVSERALQPASAARAMMAENDLARITGILLTGMCVGSVYACVPAVPSFLVIPSRQAPALRSESDEGRDRDRPDRVPLLGGSTVHCRHPERRGHTDIESTPLTATMDLSRSHGSQQGAALMKQTTKYVGLDVHQATTVAVVGDDTGRVIARSVVPTEEAALLEFVRGMRGAVHVAFEEGTQAQWLYDLFVGRVARVIVANRRGEPRRGSKGDWHDAEWLMDRLRTGELRAVYHGSPHRATLKELGRAYRNVVEDATRVMSRLKALFRGRGIRTTGRGVYDPAQRAEWLAKLDG